jgi:hypothetical protein
MSIRELTFLDAITRQAVKSASLSQWRSRHSPKSATGITYDFGGLVHGRFQLRLIHGAKVASSQKSQQLGAARAYPGQDDSHRRPVKLDFDNLPALNNPIQDALAFVGQLGGAHNHIRKYLF